MNVELRQRISKAATTVVVKVGSRVLTEADGSLHEQRIAALADEISAIRDRGRHVVLVSSGAVAAGMGRLGLPTRPRDLATLQAVAAVGQARLIETYDRTFRRHGLHTAQVLVTVDDFDDRARYLNVRNTLNSLLELGVVPIVNENDTVAVDELMVAFGDNDHLAGLVTNLLSAPLLVIMSDVDGLYDGDPELSTSQLISTVDQIDEQIMSLVQDRPGGVSKGGMASKLRAAHRVTSAGGNMIIAGGSDPSVLSHVLDGKAVGTLFPALGKAISPRKRWIAFSAQSRGRLQLDPGACAAIVEKGRSLLAIGITGSRGNFGKGDVVSLCDQRDTELARGLTNYDVAEISKIMGLKSDQIAAALGHCPYDEVIHRDNLAIL